MRHSGEARTVTEPAISAIVIAQHDASGRLRRMIDRLETGGVRVRMVDELDEARALVGRSEALNPPVVFVHVADASGDIEELTLQMARLRGIREALAGIEPVVVTADAGANMILACF